MHCGFVTEFLNGGILWSDESAEAWKDHTILKPGSNAGVKQLVLIYP